MANAATKRISKLYSLNSIEPKDDFEERMELWYNTLQNKLKDLSEKETHDVLIGMVSQNPEDVTMGLLYGILTNRDLAQKYYRDLTMTTRDGMLVFFTKLNYIILERYPKLLDIPRQQLMWFVREAIKNNVQYMDNVCANLLRCIVGGDTTARNLWLADSLLTLFNEYRQWFDKFPFLIGNAVYCYLRLLSDHFSPQFEGLRKKEIQFCVHILREKFIECINILGRELGRALIIVAKIPEFERLWTDILSNPSSISPQFTGVWHLLSAKIQKRAYTYRLPLEIERKVYFLLREVRTANQKTYLDWLHKQLMPKSDMQFDDGIELQTLRSDIIRYTLCMVHPPNEILASDVIPRWSFVLWVLNTCSNSVEHQLCRLSLFYDYFFFEADKESIMNIEPAILLLYNCMKTQPSLVASLMDFLCRMTVNLCPLVLEQVRASVQSSFVNLTEKKVVPSLLPLFENPKFDSDLKLIIRSVFEELCSPKEKEEEPSSSAVIPTLVTIDNASANIDIEDVPLSIDENDAEMSDEGVSTLVDDTENGDENGEIQAEIDVVPKKERRTSQLAIWESDGDLINPFDDPKSADINDSLSKLDPSLRPLFDDLQQVAEDSNALSTRFYQLLVKVYDYDDLEDEQAALVADCLCGLFRPFFARKVFPTKINSDTDLDETLQAPIFMIFRNLCYTPEEDNERRPQLLLASEMYLKQPRIGYLLLYFLKVSQTAGDKMMVYRDMCKLLEEDLETMLLRDMKLCQEDDYRLFLYLIPDVYKKFPTVALQSPELMHLIVSILDANQLQDIICEIVRGNLSLFKKDSFVGVLNASLKWETLEQFFFWQLVHAEDVPLEWMMVVIPKLKATLHAEAISNILLMLKRLDKDPSTLLVRQILSRDPNDKKDLFVVSALKILIDGYEEKMGELITNILSKSSSSPETSGHGKTKKPIVKTPTLEVLLGHLDMFRKEYRQGANFFSRDVVQQCLQDVKKSASETLKTRFSELFAMMEILDSVRDGRSLRRGRKVAASSSVHLPNITTTGESSDEEKSKKSSMKTAPKKKRKILELEDSD